jgi:hypothetical protein
MLVKLELLCSPATATLALTTSSLVILPSSRITLVNRRTAPSDGARLTRTGHYIENTSDSQNLTFIEIYKADRVADVSLTQWLALTPADIVADVLKIPVDVVQGLKKEKQVFVHGR